jgi:hypothetical protein
LPLPEEPLVIDLSLNAEQIEMLAPE